LTVIADGKIVEEGEKMKEGLKRVGREQTRLKAEGVQRIPE
jgi:ADP-ribose pyrophosphatase YjhB (NUDIX family)